MIIPGLRTPPADTESTDAIIGEMIFNNSFMSEQVFLHNFTDLFGLIFKMFRIYANYTI